jgi:hypothetical protein
MTPKTADTSAKLSPQPPISTSKEVLTTRMDEFVQVPVHKQHLARVYAFLGSLNEEATRYEQPAAESGDNERATGWTPDLIERQYRESKQFMRRFQKHLAEHPGQQFSTSEMAVVLDAPKGSKSVAGALGAYGRRVTNRYKQSDWLFKAWWGDAGEVIYSMPEEYAAIIRDL